MAVLADAGVLRPAVRLTIGPEVAVGSQMPVDKKKKNYYPSVTSIRALKIGFVSLKSSSLANTKAVKC